MHVLTFGRPARLLVKHEGKCLHRMLQQPVVEKTDAEYRLLFQKILSLSSNQVLLLRENAQREFELGTEL